MKLNVYESGIMVLPETTHDKIYIKTVLGLKDEGDTSEITRNPPTPNTDWYLHIPKR